MTPFLKNAAPEDLSAELDRLEKQSDRCYEQLELLRVPQNLAVWASLAWLAGGMESAHTESFASFRATMMNYGRTGALLIDWIQKHGNKELSPRSKFRWHDRLARASANALVVAHAYPFALQCFLVATRCRAPACAKALILRIAESIEPGTIIISRRGDGAA